MIAPTVLCAAGDETGPCGGASGAVGGHRPSLRIATRLASVECPPTHNESRGRAVGARPHSSAVTSKRQALRSLRWK